LLTSVVFVLLAILVAVLVVNRLSG